MALLIAATAVVAFGFMSAAYCLKAVPKSKPVTLQQVTTYLQRAPRDRKGPADTTFGKATCFSTKLLSDKRSLVILCTLNKAYQR